MFQRKCAFVLLLHAVISSIASGQSLLYQKRNCTCDSDCDSKEYGDPHFRTWGNNFYDFQRSCDMIHVRNSFLDFHIRTKYRGGFSAVTKLALRFTTDIMEMADDGSLALNGAPATAPFNLDGIYPVTSVVTGYGTEVTVLMSGGQSMLLTSRGRGGINIWIDAHGSDFCDSQGMAGTWVQEGWFERDGVTEMTDFCDSQGMAGTWVQEGWFERDGVTEMINTNTGGGGKYLEFVDYGIEWEVDALSGDPVLFSTPATDSCTDPPVCDPLDPYFSSCSRRQRERKLQPVNINLECSLLCTNPSDVENCVFDWNAVGEAETRNNSAYTEVWEATQRCKALDLGADPTMCEQRGGECVYRCDPEVSFCLDDMCKKASGISVLPGDEPSPDATYIEGCSCAVPKPIEPTPPPIPPPTPSPTPCPPPIISYPAIAGYLPRTNAGECLEWDLIQKEFQEIMSDESCSSLDLGENYYDSGPGEYFQTIPNFDSPESTVYREYTKYYGKSNFVQIWVEKAFKMTQTNFLR
eukprot:CAMPEP_0197196758 /NCGR_PEP_ID=MMETSP1423-20130617/32524_1 /TAXON_ID=476441 /ORGANISM="Pseudo-nitzschia heimii, Strain UNC1101" /LENGTH=522 /DNA_ID=CAMNT_0042650571 /DNA_START=68 /DNA_END=1632 /DNA_ORIENTATION=+